uniref:Uncharacterized protein n=1 Tax=Arundo donax TaxID=35708 RepID=A0A0A9AHC1_ARUDO
MLGELAAETIKDQDAFGDSTSNRDSATLAT